MKRMVGMAVGAGLLLSMAQAVRAQEEATPNVARGAGEENLITGYGVSIQGGGGVTNFTSQSVRSYASTGGYWDVRLVLATRRILALEGAYVGSARPLSDTVSSNSTLLGNGAEADLRLNAPIVAGDMLVEPFIFGGIGWTHYSTSGSDNNFVNVRRSDDVGTIPFGAGIALGYRGLIVDARFTYRPTFDNQLIFLSDGSRANLQNWAVGVQLGYEF